MKFSFIEVEITEDKLKRIMQDVIRDERFINKENTSLKEQINGVFAENERLEKELSIQKGLMTKLKNRWFKEKVKEATK